MKIYKAKHHKCMWRMKHSICNSKPKELTKPIKKSVCDMSKIKNIKSFHCVPSLALYFLKISMTQKPSSSACY